MSTKTFLVKRFALLFCLTAAVTFSVGLGMTIVQVNSMHSLFIERIANIVEGHKNEFLNEISLQDSQALNDHLEILKTELAVDMVRLQVEGRTYQSSSIDSKTSFLPKLGDLLLRLVDVQPAQFKLTNEFQSIHANLEIDYRRSFSGWAAEPLVGFSMIYFVFSLLPVAAVFSVLFRQINSRLLQPLETVTTSFFSKENYGLKFKSELREISSLSEASQRLKSDEKKAAMAEIAQQVAHDIRSPLSALNLVTTTLSNVPEEKRMIIRNATARINDIANSLLRKSRPQVQTVLPSPTLTTPIAELNPPRGVVMLSTLVDSIVSEKRMQFRDREDVNILVDLQDSYGLFVSLNVTEMSRAISNVMNNSMEALTGRGGVISIRVHRTSEGWGAVTIKDNGCGIPSTILGQLGKPGVTYGKSGTDSGSGLGVYQAERCALEAGGRLQIESTVGIGTTVAFLLPTAKAPEWFLDEIELSPNSIFVSVDDDPTIHQMWSGRLKSQGISGKGRHLRFANLSSFEEWHKVSSPIANSNYRYFIDYEFTGEVGNGPSTIAKLGIAKQSILVSSRSDIQLHRDAAILGLKILSKADVVLIKIKNLDGPHEFQNQVTV